MSNGLPKTRAPRRLRRIALALALATACLGMGAPVAIAVPVSPSAPVTTHAPATQAPGSTTSTPPAPVVVIVLSPFLTWHDLSPTRTPALWRLAETGAVGNLNALTADPGWPTVAGGALTLSAGRWAATAPSSAAEPSSLAALRAANASSLEVPVLGALGDAAHRAGMSVWAIGNGDGDTSTPAGTRRPAALVAMDESGRFGDDTGRDMLQSDPSAPFGVRADLDALTSDAELSIAKATETHAPRLIVVDPGDLARAHDATGLTPAQAAAAHASAVAELDSVVSDVEGVLASDALLLVVTPATDKPYYQPPYLGPIIAYGRGLVGDLTSASTHRPGLVANLDVPPSVLAAFGIAPPPTMIGQPMRATPTSVPLATRIARFERLNATVGAVDYVRDLYFISLFVGVTIAVLLLAVALALLPLEPVRFLGRWWLLLVLSVPPAAWLLFLVERFPTTPARVAAALAVATIAVFAAALAVALLVRRRPELPLLVLATLTSLVICADQWLGKPLESGLFSYSIRAGWRYYGMGNEGAALLVGASLAAVSIACDLAAETRWALPLRRFGIPLVGLVALFTAAAPTAGANAGVAVWGMVAFAVTWVRANRLRFTWKTIAGMLAAIVLLVVAFVALDVVRGSGGETHLGRFFGEIATGGPGAVWELVRRKAINNWNYLPQTPYSWLALALVAALALERWVPPRPQVTALAERPAYAAALLGVLVGGVAALFTEDSGIVMPALMLLAGATPALYLALLPSRTSEGSEAS